MSDRTALSAAPRNTLTCPPWCTLGAHTHLDPHHASIGTICAPGFEAEMVVRQPERIPGAKRVPSVEVALTLDITGPDGKPTGVHTLATPLPAGTDVEAFLADSDHEPPAATVVVAPGVTFEPYRRRPVACDPPRRPLAWARQVLAKTATGHGTFAEAVAQVLELRVALEQALAAVDRAGAADELA